MNLNAAMSIADPGEKVEIIFEETFKTHFRSLYSYAFTILHDEAVGEEMVQNVFFKLWERKDQTMIHSSLKAYLYRSVHNECMNHLKHAKVKKAHQTYSMHRPENESGSNPVEKLGGKELEGRIRAALNELPEQCRTIFQMSRFDELKYREIADKLQLSVKTVENQMGKALHLLRIKLAEFMVSLIIFSFTSKLF